LSGNRWGRRMRGALVISEVALSLIVLIGAGLLVKSFAQLIKVDAGFAADNLLTMNIELFRFKDPQRRAAVARDCAARLAQIPGVRAAGCGTGLPPVTPQRGTRFAIEGKEINQGDDGAYFIATTPDYFRALGTPLIEGRSFNDSESESGPLAAIINQSLARKLFPNESPLGKHLKLINPEQSSDWRAIVGVVGDVKYSGLDDTGEAAIYTPFAQTPFLWAYVMVRTEPDAGNLIASIRSAVSSVDPSISAVNLRPMSSLVSESVAQPRFQMMLLAAFALLALVLAAVGLYGVMSYLVTQRTREIGVRMALGARPSDVLKIVVGQGMTLAAAGCAVGIGGALAVTRLMASLLYGVSPTDAATFAVVSLALLGVALGACFVPALRAAKVDPMVALRHE
jgi:putative ABC transport system permease protein